VLVDVLQDADAGIRAQACIAFRQLGTDGKAGIPALITRLSDPDLHVRSCAATGADEDRSRRARAARPRPEGARSEARRAAAEIIGTFGSEAKSASVELADASKDEDAGVNKPRPTRSRKSRWREATPAPTRGRRSSSPPTAINRRVVGYKWAKVGLFVHWGIYSVPLGRSPASSPRT